MEVIKVAPSWHNDQTMIQVISITLPARKCEKCLGLREEDFGKQGGPGESHKLSPEQPSAHHCTYNKYPIRTYALPHSLHSEPKKHKTPRPSLTSGFSVLRVSFSIQIKHPSLLRLSNFSAVTPGTHGLVSSNSSQSLLCMNLNLCLPTYPRINLTFTIELLYHNTNIPFLKRNHLTLA